MDNQKQNVEDNKGVSSFLLDENSGDWSNYLDKKVWFSIEKNLRGVKDIQVRKRKTGKHFNYQITYTKRGKKKTEYLSDIKILLHSLIYAGEAFSPIKKFSNV